MTGLAGWRARLGAYAHPAVRAMLFLGFASGLPFPLVLTTLSARLRQSGIDRTTIGYFSLVGLAYSLKFFWSPVVDRMHLPLIGGLGRRRGWMLVAQAGVIAGLVAMALHDPAADPLGMARLAVFTAFCAATQDIAVDAFRIESAPVDWQGATAAAYQTGYQVALIAGGAGALLAASSGGWTFAYVVMAAAMGLGLVTTLLVAEPPRAVLESSAPEARVSAFLDRSAHWPRPLRFLAAQFIGGVVCPFLDFFTRYPLRTALAMLALVVLFRLNYTTMGVAANTFYLDLGYRLDQIAVVSKVYGVLMTLVGALGAGLLVRALGVLRTMLLGVLLLSAANLLYGFLAAHFAPQLNAHAADATSAGPPLLWLAAAVSLDNIANGIAGTAFIAYLSSLTSAAYTATQYALFGTLWSLPAKTLASQWGRIVDHWGYPAFFVYTAVIGLPAALLLLVFLRREAPKAG